MARKQRVHYEGALYHVICRGNNREYVFGKEEDKKIYLETVIRYKKKYNFKLYAYCIMGNHVHLLIEVDKVPLSKIMQGIQLAGPVAFIKMNIEMPIDEFCNKLVKEKGVLLLPASIYSFPGQYFRMGFGRENFAKSDEMKTFIKVIFQKKSNQKRRDRVTLSVY